MKTKIMIILCGLLLFSMNLKAQNSIDNIKIHKAWVTLVDGTRIKGHLYSVTKNEIKITINNSKDFENLRTINAKDIKVIKIRRKGKVENALLTGGLTGVGLSVLFGAATSSDDFFTPGETMLYSSILLVPLGTGIGAIVGTKKEKFKIGGNMAMYQSILNEIQRYSIQANLSIEIVN